MSGFSFWVPFNGDFKLLDKLRKHFADGLNGNKIEGIYFPAPQEFFGSARVVKTFTTDDAKKVVAFCKKLGWKSNMLLNSSCGGADWYSPKTISKTLFLVKNMKTAGLTSITITNPIYLQKIKKEIPDINITVSVISEIASVQRAKLFEDLGADAFVPDRDINRNLELLKDIKDSNDMDMILMVNEGCLYRCPQRNIHYNFISHWSKTEKETYSDFMTNYCIDLRGKNPEELLKMQFILPQHLRFYKNITSSFKIVGRTRSTEDILQITKAYLKERWDGNLLDLMSSATPGVQDKYGYTISAKTLDDTFLKKVTKCNKNCAKCDFCKNVIETNLTQKHLVTKIKQEWDKRFKSNPELSGDNYLCFGKPDKHIIDFICLNDISPHSTLLDLGCGNGKNTFWFAKNGFNSYGIDFSKSAITFAKNKIKDTHFLISLGQELPFQNKLFDVVIDAGLIHVNPPIEQKRILAEITRVIKPNGLFFTRLFMESKEHPKVMGSIASKIFDWRFNEKDISILFSKDFEILKVNVENAYVAPCFFIWLRKK